MSESDTATQSPLTAEMALSIYSDAPLARLRPDHVNRWAEGFGHAGLASDVLANPRLETRIASEVCRSLGLTRISETPKTAYRPTLIALAQLGPDRFADLLGCTLHWHTVLGWITWGQLQTHLPDLPTAQIRALLQILGRPRLETLAPDDFKKRLARGRAEEPQATLTAAELRRDGNACLGAWLAAVPPAMRKRLGLFYEFAPEIWPDTGTADEAERACALVVSVAGALQEVPA